MEKWKNLIFTHSIKEIVILFNSTFLGIYFFKITEGSILTVALYYLVYYSSHILWRYVVSKFMHSKNVIKIYRFSIFTSLIISCILLLFRENIVNYIYMFATIYAFSQCLYWTSYEIIVSDLNKKNSFNKYFTYDSVLGNISSLIFPLTFGVVIEKYSYFIVFIILCVIALISFLVSLTIKDVEIECQKIKLKDFFKNLKDKKMLGLIGFQSISDGLTNGGVASLLTTLLIFSKVSSETFIGYISTGLSVICIIIAIIAEKKLNYNNYKKVVLPISIFAFLVTIPLSIKATVVMVIIYKVVFSICNLLINVEGNSVLFNSINIVCEEKHKIAYLWFQELTLNIGRDIGILSIILIYKLSNNLDTLFVLFILFSSFLVIRTIVITKIQNVLKKQK